jgi:hypothetical protein
MIITREKLVARGAPSEYLLVFDIYGTSDFELLLSLVEDCLGGSFHTWLCNEFLNEFWAQEVVAQELLI